MTGDGELQEGQIWESLQPAANERLGEIIVIVDHNKLQSDSAVSAVSDLGAIEDKFRAFGWEVQRANGHDLRAVRDVFAGFDAIPDRPKVLIADTVKGKGVSFMEGLACGDATYHFHAGAPSLKDYLAAVDEIAGRVNARLAGAEAAGDRPRFGSASRAGGAVTTRNGWSSPTATSSSRSPAPAPTSSCSMPTCCRIAGSKRSRPSCPSVSSSAALPSSTWCPPPAGWRCAGLLPVVHSFACFLSTRANEHIYNNATERRKIIYTATLAGAVPGGPGHSHQSVRDISAIGSVPGLTVIEPCCERESRLAIRWAVERNDASTYLRFVNVPLDLPYSLPASYSLEAGRGVTLRPGTDVAIIGYGPVLMTSAWRAADELSADGVSAAVINLPWLNRIDDAWVRETLGRFATIITLDNHYVTLGQGVMVAAALARNGVRAEVRSLGLTDIPACGTNAEVLAHHGLDGSSIARAIQACIHTKSSTG